MGFRKRHALQRLDQLQKEAEEEVDNKNGVRKSLLGKLVALLLLLVVIVVVVVVVVVVGCWLLFFCFFCCLLFVVCWLNGCWLFVGC